MDVVYQLRRATSWDWAEKNSTLREGEPGIETDTKKWKSGDGITRWNDLGYMVGVAPDDDGPSLVLLYENAKV